MGRKELKAVHDHHFFRCLMDVIQGQSPLKFVEIQVDGRNYYGIYTDESTWLALKFTVDQILKIEKDKKPPAVSDTPPGVQR